MQRVTIFFIYLIISFSTSCKSNLDCEGISSGFISYEQAESLIREATYSFKDTNYPNSDWIEKLEFFSCDGSVGYLILSTKKGKSYLYQNIPIDVWEELEKADSKGKVYHKRIKSNNDFQLIFNKL